VPVFVYEGKSSGGKDVAGEIEAENLEAAQQIVRSRRITEAKVKKKPAELSLPGFGPKKVGAAEVTGFSRQFATMIDAGLPLVQCLNILQDQQENPTFGAALKKITGDVEAGATLSEAMAKHTNIFNSLFINMVAAGEVGGILDEVLLRVSEYMEKADSLRRKIKGAMMYPIVVLTVALGATAVLLIFVIPNFVGMFESSGVPLPWPTKLVVNLSNFVARYILVIIAIVAGLYFLFKQYYATDKGEQVVDNIKLNAPIFGELTRKSSVARFSRTL